MNPVISACVHSSWLSSNCSLILLVANIMLMKKLKLSNELASRFIDFQTPPKQKEELFLKQKLLKKRKEKEWRK